MIFFCSYVLYRLEFGWPRGELGARIDDLEPGDALVRLFAALELGHFEQLFGRVGRKEAPTFVARHQTVPGARSQRIDVNARARASRSQNEPAIGRTLFLARILEEILIKVFRYGIVIEQLLLLWMLAKARLEQIERRIVNVILNVLPIVFHFEFNRVAFVVFAHLKVFVAEFLLQFLN